MWRNVVTESQWEVEESRQSCVRWKWSLIHYYPHTHAHRVTTKKTTIWTLKTVQTTNPCITNNLILTDFYWQCTLQLQHTQCPWINIWSWYSSLQGVQSAYKYPDYTRRVLRLTWHWTPAEYIKITLKNMVKGMMSNFICERHQRDIHMNKDFLIVKML